VSPQKPWIKKYGTREVPVIDYWKLEFYDFQQLTENILSPEEAELRRVAHAIRNKVAHPDLVKPDQIARISDYYEAHRDLIEGDVPGWNWPRCGQSMILTVGPSGGGKSRWSAEQGVEVVSSDEIRKETTPTGRRRAARRASSIGSGPLVRRYSKKDATSSSTPCMSKRNTDFGRSRSRLRMSGSGT
jgi:hypothetical protein